MIPRGVRNRNFGNIEFGQFAIACGATASDGRFAIFPTNVAGLTALAKLLLIYNRKPDGKGGVIDTVEEVINRWAPANENRTSAYITFVCTMLECEPDDRFDFHDPAFLFWMVTAIGEEECGPKAFSEAVTDEEIDAAVAAALAA